MLIINKHYNNPEISDNILDNFGPIVVTNLRYDKGKIIVSVDGQDDVIIEQKDFVDDGTNSCLIDIC